jgi:hypothetical protein
VREDLPAMAGYGATSGHVESGPHLIPRWPVVSFALRVSAAVGVGVTVVEQPPSRVKDGCVGPVGSVWGGDGHRRAAVGIVIKLNFISNYQVPLNNEHQW